VAVQLDLVGFVVVLVLVLTTGGNFDDDVDSAQLDSLDVVTNVTCSTLP